MAQYIDKEVIVTEIEKRKQKLLDHIICERDKEWAIRTAHLLNRIIWFLDTLEVKEVDLGKEINLWVEDNTCKGYCSADIHETAEHFFELGLKTKGE